MHKGETHFIMVLALVQVNLATVPDEFRKMTGRVFTTGQYRSSFL